ncbi:MAG: hypothetical protein AAGU27_17375 [Dehalobacterium sp.]
MAAVLWTRVVMLIAVIITRCYSESGVIHLRALVPDQGSILHQELVLLQ